MRRTLLLLLFVLPALIVILALLPRERGRLPEGDLPGPRAAAPESAEELFAAGQAAVARREFADAVRYFDQLPADAPQGAEAALQAAKITLRELGRAREAEARFRALLDRFPDQPEALSELATLWGIEARRWEAVPLIQRLFQLGRMNVHQLTLLGTRFGVLVDAELLKRCHQADPQDAGVLLGLAACPALPRPLSETRRLLEQAIAQDHDLLEAHARLGAILKEQQDEPAWGAWLRQLPAHADEHPEIWALRGEWARAHDEDPAAIRCFVETLRRDANHRPALYQLAQLLQDRGHSAEAQQLYDRHEQLQRFQQTADTLLHDELSDTRPLAEASRQLEELGRIWEAWGWSVLAMQLDRRQTWAQEQSVRLFKLLAQDPPLTLAEANPVRNLDPAAYPLPTLRPALLDAPPAAPPATEDSLIALADVAANLGLDFRYYNHAHPAEQGKRMYEFPGGGVGVLDYDADGWPDLYWTQGTRWPGESGPGEYLDALYRQIAGRFENVTSLARVEEAGFSHGLAVGDFDNDGFPDLYVANIGRNRLFHNCGDGTFRDVTEQIRGDAERWTTSCLMADLNGDGCLDLYDVNYLEAGDLFERICRHPDGTPRMCLPFHFASAADQFYLSGGDGSFTEAAESSGLHDVEGKGLGVVAADLEGDGRLSIFVANDVTPNFLFVNEASRGSAPRFREQGVAAGLAFNAEGRAEACMGVAAGDANADGRLDLFVGNFYKESNTLYLQDDPLHFHDGTRAAGLAEPSWEFLAFGTQFLDADLDGDQDLFVTNGHLDDLRRFGRPYAMRPQLFANNGSGKFQELRSNSARPCLAEERLGRGLARLDYNRDGRPDLAVTQLESPAALLQNRTTTSRSYLAVYLRGTISDRDAIGATVTVSHADQVQVQQLTAGDGYHASNQRLLLFGLPEVPFVRLHVRWPAGETRSWEAVPVNGEVLLLEGHSEFSRLPGVADVGDRD